MLDHQVMRRGPGLRGLPVGAGRAGYPHRTLLVEGETCRLPVPHSLYT